MQLGFLTDGVPLKTLPEVLTMAAELGLDGVELTCGNWSKAPHLDLETMAGSSSARQELQRMLDDHGLTLLALNASGNQLHPLEGAAHDAVVRQTMRLASELGVETVVLMSGLPAGAPGDTMPNWITSSWPPEAETMLEYQWQEVAIPYWRGLSSEAERLGVKLAVEMHGRQLVHNVASFRRLLGAIGSPALGANLDPSHLMWQGADILSVIEELGPDIAHVHAKDVRIERRRAAVDGVLDPQSPAQAATRTWNYVTLGNGHVGGKEFWREFVYALHAVGYCGPLSIEHEDVLVGGEEGIRRAVGILQPLLFHDAPDWAPAEV